MPYYMFQVSYSQESITAMVKKPEDRAATVRAIAEKFGVKMHSFYLCFGDYDAVVILEAPDNVTMTAISMVVSASGAMNKLKDHCVDSFPRGHAGHGEGWCHGASLPATWPIVAPQL